MTYREPRLLVLIQTNLKMFFFFNDFFPFFIRVQFNKIYLKKQTFWYVDNYPRVRYSFVVQDIFNNFFL